MSLLLISIIIILNCNNIPTLVAKCRFDSFRLRGTGSMCHMILLNVEFRRRRRGFMVGGGGVGSFRPDERALKQRTRWTGVFLVLRGSSTLPVISARALSE